MSANNPQRNEYIIPIFGLTKSQLRPIINNIVSNEPVDSFDVSIEHEVQGYYGYQAEKIIPTFIYTTTAGNTGKVIVFVKWFYREGPAEAHNYIYLAKHNAPIPRMYGTFKSHQREMLFLEYLTPVTDSDGFLNDADQFHQFLALVARFNAIQPSQEYASQLPRHDIGRSLKESVPVLNSIWDYACKGELGDALKQFCSSSEDNLNRLQNLAKQLIAPVNQMETGIAHTDFYPENTGWRRETRELLMLDLEFVGFAPWFYDVAGWIGAPDDIQPRCLPRRELAQYYLEQYIRRGGCPVQLEQFLEETHILWMAGELKMLGWRLGRALDGCVDWTDDHEEGRRFFREGLRRDLSILLRQVS
ncbi:phosphotransferase [bacterium]|nr:phosphotransferase [bacterium]